jgi:hypothetical protein
VSASSATHRSPRAGRIRAATSYWVELGREAELR